MAGGRLPRHGILLPSLWSILELADWSGSLRINVFLGLVCLVGLGEVLAREPYADYPFRSQARADAVYRQDHFRWRPLNQEEARLHENPSTGPYSDTDQGQTRPAIYPPIYTDYAETPPGLPRGVFRPVEERHAIIPHMDGYRFRTLTPDEQQHIKRRNERYEQAWQPKRREKHSSSSLDGYSYAEPQRRETYRYRPDERLDNKRGGNWGRPDGFPYNPAFTDAYQAPMFRPE